MPKEIIPSERITQKIYFLRGKKVMFDRDLAVLYGVETRALNQAVRRNLRRFPEDFMFQLNKKELEIWKSHIVISSQESDPLRSQIVTLKGRGKHSKYVPLAFTEQGVAMLSSVLKSERAIQVNIQIIRTFTTLREMLLTHKELKDKLERLERKYDKQFRVVFQAIKLLIREDAKPKSPLGFTPDR